MDVSMEPRRLVPRKFAKRPGVWFNLYSNQNQCPIHIFPRTNTATYVLFDVCIPDDEPDGSDTVMKSCSGPTNTNVVGVAFSSKNGSCSGTTQQFTAHPTDL